LDGLGGVGKTQIALEVAYQIQEMSPECSVFWVQASDTTSFNNSYCEIGQKLRIPGLEDEKADVKQLVFTTLKGLLSPWLLIVDNADDYEVLSNAEDGNASWALIKYLPSRGHGAVLFTTRDNKIATKFAEANVIHIKEMSRPESTELLRKSVQDKNQSLLNDQDSITELLELLLDLPLAIKQAAAYINENSTPISEYLLFYQRSEQDIIEVLSEDFEDYGRYNSQKNPVATTWLISFEQIRRQYPLAVEYLSFIGVILQDDIPISLLQPGKSLLKQDKAIGTLTAYSFITRRIGEEAFNVHRLVYLATRNWLSMKDELLIWADRALNRLVEVIPAGGHTNREVWTRYLPHGIHLVNTIKVHCNNEMLMIKLLDQIGRCQHSIGQYTGAENMHQRTLVLKEKMLGKDHHKTLMSRNELGLALSRQGKDAEAEEIYRETLALRETVLGKDHPKTLKSRSNLGLALRGQGKYAEVEAIHRETLALREKVLGKDHPLTLISRNNLGAALSDQGKYTEAEEMHRKTLTLRKKVLGKEHPNTLISRNNLGLALSRQGKYAEAEAMHREALALLEKVLGKDHPKTLLSRNNLMHVLSRQGN
jgi:tetratricopeptide (TPR) repeat protein